MWLNLNSVWQKDEENEDDTLTLNDIALELDIPVSIILSNSGLSVKDNDLEVFNSLIEETSYSFDEDIQELPF